MSTQTMEHYRGQGVLTQGERRAEGFTEFVVEREKIWVGSAISEPMEVDGMLKWEGTFATNEALEFLADTVLELPDGRRGNVVLTGLEMVAATSLKSESRQVLRGGTWEFHGDGDAPSA